MLSTGAYLTYIMAGVWFPIVVRFLIERMERDIP